MSFLALGAALRAAADAHPLGNFTINHLARVRTDGRTLRVRYVLDIAEIPTFQIIHERAPDGNWTPKIRRAWADSEVAVVQNGLHIAENGRPVALRPGVPQVRSRPGAGGLPILYWTDEFRGELSSETMHSVTVTDRVYEDRRIGWKDIVAGPQTEPTHELLLYPSSLIGSPRSITALSFHVSSAGAVSAIHSDSGIFPQQQSSSSMVNQTLLSQMFLRADQSAAWIFITILAAFGFGALHAIEPGHGKALLAVTLVGARATPKQAATLAAALTFAHTAGVVLLGVVLFFVTGFVPEAIYPWITFVSGIVIVVIGGRALARYVRGIGPFAHAHMHEHPGAHAHDHEHCHSHVLMQARGHDHVHPVGTEQAHEHGAASHSHTVPGSQPLRFGSAVWAAMGGGIAPCPAAIILLIAAVNSHRVGYGLLLIVIFGLGLASVLTGLGFAVVRGAAWISSNAKYERLVRFGPLASAALISIIGAVLLAQGFVQLGVPANVPLIAGLTLAAMGGYALSAQHVHSALGRAA